MKNELRLRFRALRDAQSPSERARASTAIAGHFRSLPEYEAARTVLFYATLSSEIDTGPLLEDAEGAGKRTILPRMEGASLTLHTWRPGDFLEANRHGIREPASDAARVSVSDVDLAVVPGLAFDRRGRRLGYGGGYYDRLLHAAPKAFRVGLAYDFQVTAILPSTHLDAPMDCLITPSGVQYLGKRRV